MGTFIPNPLLPMAMKSLLQRETSVMLSLDNWCHSLQLLPLSVPESKMVFQQMLVHCKITKFYKVNFKILAQILATPKILATVKNQDNIHWCVWCGAEGTLEHILLHCPETIAIHSFWKKI